MTGTAGAVVLVVVLILLGGAFTGAEFALVSLREGQIRRLAETRGKRGRRLARLTADPNRFLAAIQIGITVATMLSSAVGAATLSHGAATWLIGLGFPASWAQPVSLVVITLIIAFVSLVLGELTPKRLGLQRAESFALLASGPLTFIAALFRPVVWLSGVCTNGAVRILGGDPHIRGEGISEEELHGLVQAHESLSGIERRVISDVFAAEDTVIREVMVARPDVEFLPASMTLAKAAKHIDGMPYSRFPVTGRDIDDVVGVVHITSILTARHPLGRAATVGDVAGPVTVLPGTKSVLDALHEMRTAGQVLAVVADEYDGTDGIVTIEDLIEEVVGEMRGADRPDPNPNAVADEPIGVDGRLNLDDFAEQTGVQLPSGPYDTAGGYVMARLGRLPVAGDRVRMTDTAADGGIDTVERDAVAGHGASAGDADRAGGADRAGHGASAGDADRAGGERGPDHDADRGSDDEHVAREVELVVAAMDGRRIARITVMPTAAGRPVHGSR